MGSGGAQEQLFWPRRMPSAVERTSTDIKFRSSRRSRYNEVLEASKRSRKRLLASRTSLYLERLEDRNLMSVDVLSTADGIRLGQNNCSCAPPDPMIAAGPAHFIQVVNTAIAIHD